MIPVTLRTRRLVLDQPVASDRDALVEYCRDPLFEKFMTLPWPYQPQHADFFTSELAPQVGESGAELTWSIGAIDCGSILDTPAWRSGGNTASAGVARKTGFRYTGERPSELTFRDGSHPLAWHGVLSLDRAVGSDTWPT
jgi:RimJ/RimL family protein N-acetyltransferase